MRKEIIIGFHDFLSERANYGVAGEKPIFIMAVLSYMLEKDVFKVSLIDLLHPQHRLKMKRHFLYFASLSGKLKVPERSWDMVAGREHLEIKSAIDEYVSEVEDVNQAFAKLNRKDTEELLTRFSKDLKSSISISK